jgi:hypothetical protein
MGREQCGLQQSIVTGCGNGPAQEEKGPKGRVSSRISLNMVRLEISRDQLGLSPRTINMYRANKFRIIKNQSNTTSGAPPPLF